MYKKAVSLEQQKVVQEVFLYVGEKYGWTLSKKAQTQVDEGKVTKREIDSLTKMVGWSFDGFKDDMFVFKRFSLEKTEKTALVKLEDVLVVVSIY